MNPYKNFHRGWMSYFTMLAVVLGNEVVLVSNHVNAGWPEEIILVDFSSAWRYWDQDHAPPEKWNQAEFSDATWPSGIGLLGYETGRRRDRWPEPGLQTEVTPNQLNYLFRTSFEYQGEVDGVQLKIDHVIDDAAIIFLNGIEIARTDRLPEGDIPFGTRATSSVSTPSLVEDGWIIDNPPLRVGENIVAVSLHNQSARSSDACLGLRLRVSNMPVEPLALYLSWQADPTSTMTIQWHTAAEVAATKIEYRKRGEQEAPSAEIHPQAKPMVFSDRMIQTAELTRLTPDTEYEFRIFQSNDRTASRWYWFRTMPKDIEDPHRPIRLVFGGDLMHQAQLLAAANRQAMRLNPDAIIWGGDLAYANGVERNLSRWEQFFDTCLETLVTAEGRVVPIIVGIGNHEVQGGYYWGNERGRESYLDSDEFRSSIAPYFYNLFAFPGQPGYGVLDFEDYLSILILDTDHSNPIEGKQTQWLQQQLAQRRNVRHVIPVYHVPAFPSVRSFDGASSRRVRENWVPLFERSQVRVCFEHHDHAYKRTMPIANGRVNKAGITYLGDGAWGVGLREQHPVESTWYLSRAELEHHVLLATISGDLLMVQVFASDGRLIDQISLPPRK